jgi:hypothetical protein
MHLRKKLFRNYTLKKVKGKLTCVRKFPLTLITHIIIREILLASL